MKRQTGFSPSNHSCERWPTPCQPGPVTWPTEARAIDRELGSILAALVQMKIQSGNDVLSYPIGLANRIATVGTAVSGADARPTDQAQTAFDEVSAAIDTQLSRLTTVLGSRLTKLNKQLTAAGRRPVETGGRQP